MFFREYLVINFRLTLSGLSTYLPVLECVDRALVEEVDDADDVTGPVAIQPHRCCHHYLIALAQAYLHSQHEHPKSLV